MAGLALDHAAQAKDDWQAASLVRYTNYLRRTVGDAATLAYVQWAVQSNPRLADHPLILGL